VYNNYYRRFVKLFPLLKLHKQGIDYLTGFINNQLKLFTQSKLNDSQKTSGEPNGLLYANILMELYELIARQLEEHLPMIQSCYGNINNITCFTSYSNPLICNHLFITAISV
jgi:hypothetical protein